MKQTKIITLSRVCPPEKEMRKTPYIEGSLLKKVQTALKANSKSPIKTWSRASTILPMMVGLNFLVHNGKLFRPVYATEMMIGHKLGEFSPTRTFKAHAGTKADKASKAKVKSKPGDKK